MQTGKRYKHEGIDFLGPAGGDVYAPTSGKFEFYGRNQNTGLIIFTTNYDVKIIHLDVNSDLSGSVKQGQVIGQIKDLGPWYNKMPSHIHLEIRDKKNNPINPNSYFISP